MRRVGTVGFDQAEGIRIVARIARIGRSDQLEIVFWNSISNSTDSDDFRAYLKSVASKLD